jgi:hypothetical protein
MPAAAGHWRFIPDDTDFQHPGLALISRIIKARKQLLTVRT